MITRVDASLQRQTSDSVHLANQVQGLALAVSGAVKVADIVKLDLLGVIAAGFDSQKDHAEGQTRAITAHSDSVALRIIEEIKEQFKNHRDILESQQENDNIIQQVLSSLSFAGMRDRESNIVESSSGTNEWILGDFQHSDKAGDKPEHTWTMEKEFASRFETWLKETASTFWFNGKAGCGKSTLMKHISRHSQTIKHLATWSNGEKAPLILSFFFYSPTQERTLLNTVDGFLRSIAFQLLNHRPDLVRTVDALFDAETRNPFHTKSENAYLWRREQILALCKRLVEETAREQKIAFFIDGLDEIMRESTDPFLGFLQDLLRNDRVKACVSSRWETVFDKTFHHNIYELKLSDLNFRDIVLALRSRILPSLLAAFDPPKAITFIESVAKKSEGIFLWAAIVMREIETRLDGFSTIESLERLLDSLPAGIEPLYEHMLKKVNREEAAMYLGPLVLEHKAPALPFTLLSLAFLREDVKQKFLLGKTRITTNGQPYVPGSSKNNASPLVINERVDKASLELLVRACETTRNRIRACCRGLVEVTDQTPFVQLELYVYNKKYPRPTIDSLDQTLRNLARRVEFIHRSVGEYLRKFISDVMGENWRVQAAAHLFDIYLGGILTTRAMLRTNLETSYSEMSLSMDCFAQLLSIQSKYHSSKVTARLYNESYNLAYHAYERRVLWMDLKDMLKECGHKRITKWPFTGTFLEFSAFCGQNLCLDQGYKEGGKSQDELDQLLYLSVLGLQYCLSWYEGKTFDTPDEHYDGVLRAILSALTHGGSPGAVIYENRKDYNLCFKGSIWDRFLLTIFRKYCWGDQEPLQAGQLLRSPSTSTLILVLDQFLTHGAPLDGRIFLTPPNRTCRNRDRGYIYTLGQTKHEFILETSVGEVLGLILSALELQDNYVLPKSLADITRTASITPTLCALSGFFETNTQKFMAKPMHWIPLHVGEMAQDLAIQKVPGRRLLEIKCSEYYIRDVYEQVRAGNDLLKLIPEGRNKHVNPRDVLFFPTPRRFRFCSEACKTAVPGKCEQRSEDHWAKGDSHCLLLSDPKSIAELRPPGRPMQYNDLGDFQTPDQLHSILQDRIGTPIAAARRDSEDNWDLDSSLKWTGAGPHGPVPSRFERLIRSANKGS